METPLIALKIWNIITKGKAKAKKLWASRRSPQDVDSMSAGLLLISACLNMTFTLGLKGRIGDCILTRH